MIYTSYYANIKSLPKNMVLVSISGDGGNLAKFNGYCYKKLAPKFGFWKKWHDNIGKIDEEDNNNFYIREFQNQVLNGLDPKEIERDLCERFGENVVLLCYEKSGNFCHRDIVGDGLEKQIFKLKNFYPKIKSKKSNL